MSKCLAWSQTETDLIINHPDWTDDDLALAVSGLGTPRTAKAVEARRKRMGIRRPRPQAGPSRWHAAMRAAKGRAEGWPSVPTAYDAQDRKHLRALLAVIEGVA